MYDRQIDVENKLVFINKTEQTEMEILLPPDVTFYVEYKGDWWIEKEPFNGREKDETIKQIAMLMFEKAEKIIAERKQKESEL